MENKTVSAGTIARTICLGLALTNQILSATGHPVLPIEDAQIETLVTTGFTVATALWGYWKNNSWTPAAIEADDTMKMLKSNK